MTEIDDANGCVGGIFSWVREAGQRGADLPSPIVGARGIPYPDPDALSAELRESVTERAAPNVFRTIAHSPGLAPGFMTMASDVLHHNSLSATWRELCILRVGHRYDAIYEVYQHTLIGAAVGLSEAALAAARSGSSDELDDEHATIMRLTDVLLDAHTLTGAHLIEARNLLTLHQLTDLVLTVGFHQLVCNFLNNFQVLPEDQEATLQASKLDVPYLESAGPTVCTAGSRAAKS